MVEPSVDDELAWRLEEACANAYPCGREMRLDGWLLKADGGHTRRNNSANPLHPGAADPAGLIDVATRIYRELGGSALFRVPAMVAGADATLERLGFTMEGETVTVLGEPPAAQRFPTAGVSLDAAAGHGWLAAWRHLRPDVDPALQARAVEALLLPACFATCRVEDEPVSVAYAAIDRGVAVIESVFTHAGHRGRGHARATLQALIARCGAQGADVVCLQVQADNAPARALYASLGLRREAYRYRYRREPGGA